VRVIPIFTGMTGKKDWTPIFIGVTTSWVILFLKDCINHTSEKTGYNFQWVLFIFLFVIFIQLNAQNP